MRSEVQKNIQKTLVVVSFLALILSFQNCSKQVQKNIDSDSNTKAKNEKIYNRKAVSGFQTMTLWDYTNGQFLDLDLTTGKMMAFEEVGYVRGDQYCLLDSERESLKTIMDKAEICEPQESSEDVRDEVCTMEYRYPYASLNDSRDEIKLGEKTNGCDTPTDLCDEKGDQLKNFVSGILADLKSHKCL